MLYWFTWLLNKLLAGFLTPLLISLRVAPADPARPIPDYVGGEILAMLVIIAVAAAMRSRYSVESPGKLQHALEVVVEFTQGMAQEMIGGHDAARYVAMIGTFGIFIALCNMMGLIPSLSTPTANIPVTLGCSVVAFIYYNYHGVRQHGLLGYLKHLCGPMMAIAFLMFPIEIFSNLFRMLSLSVRLWANMLVGDILEGIFTSLVPIGVPSLFMALHLFVSLLQAYVFMILPAVYVALATAEEH
jgi:F-type H+-transporting ATPase subunit a